MKRLPLAILMLLVTACAPQSPPADVLTPAGQSPTATAQPGPAETTAPTLTPVPTPENTPVPERVTFSGDPDTRPYVTISGEISGSATTLQAAGTSPLGDTLTYTWWQDDANPAPLALSSESGDVVQVTLPAAPGEYFVNVTAQDESGNAFTARRLITIHEGGAYINGIEDHAAWISEITLYEIFIGTWRYTSGDRFRDIADYLDELVELGVNTIWLTPITTGEGAGYMTENYYEVNPDLGTEQNFRRMIEEAHARDMRVLLDLVINHTSYQHPFMLDVQENGPDSPYADYYLWNGTPGESDYQYLYDWQEGPNLNVANPEVQEYLIRVAEYWMINFDIDGYRADVAWGVEQRSNTLWHNLVVRLRNIKPEIFMLAEAPAYPVPGSYDGNPSPDHEKSILFDERFDAAYDWRLRNWNDWEGILGVFNGDQPLDHLDWVLTRTYPPNAYPMRSIENHDFHRIVEEYGLQQSLLGHTLVFTVPGIPLLYGGAEQGQADRYGGLKADDLSVQPFFTTLLNTRTRYIDNDSTLVRLLSTNMQDVYSYATISENSIAIVALNFSPDPVQVNIYLGPLAEWLAEGDEVTSIFRGGESVTLDDLSPSGFPVSLQGYEPLLLLYTDEPVPVVYDAAWHFAPELIPEGHENNLLRNGAFTQGTLGWTTYIHTAGGAGAELRAGGGQLVLDVNRAGTELWHIQLIQQNISLQAATTYQLDITMSADKACTVRVGLTLDGGDYRYYGSDDFSLSTLAETYSSTFTMTGADPSARFVLETGTNACDLTIEEVKLSEGD